MFVYYFAAISAGQFADVERAALEALDGLPGAADVAYREGEDLRAQLGLNGRPVAKTVRLEVGPPSGASGRRWSHCAGRRREPPGSSPAWTPSWCSPRWAPA